MKKRRCQNQELRHVWLSCISEMDTAAFSLSSVAHVAVSCFSMVCQLPRVGDEEEPGLRRDSCRDGVWRRAAALKVMIGLRGRQQRKTLHPPCAVRLALHSRSKWKRNLGSKYLCLFQETLAKGKKASLYAIGRNMLVKQVSWSYKQPVRQKANKVEKVR